MLSSSRWLIDISINALREESDVDVLAAAFNMNISINALREESDCL